MPTRNQKQTIPTECIRGYATLAPEFCQKAVNRVSHFSEGVLKRTFRDPILVFTDGFQVQMPAAKLIAELDGVFAPFGSYPSSYDFGRIILVLCDDSVRTAGDDKDGWPAEVPSLKKRVILEFVWRFPDGRKLPCRYWLSSSDGMLSICKFVHEMPKA